MKKAIVCAAAATALAVAGRAAASLAPWTFVGPGVSCPVVSQFSGGVLHLSRSLDSKPRVPRRARAPAGDLGDRDQVIVEIE